MLAAQDDLPAVLADRSQIEQVLLNLAVNARDAMPTGGTLTIETRRGRRPTSALIVTDTGVGMSRKTLEHVFEPFFTTKEVGQGTGLGLATVHGIVTQSGGRVHVYSEPDLGTSFKVYLPATDAAAALQPTPAGDGGRRRSRGTETILLCEDEDGVRRLVEHVLTAQGYRVLAADGPLPALELAAEPATTTSTSC